MLSLVGVVTTVVSRKVGPVVSIVNELAVRALLALLTLSVTVIVQSLYVPSDSSLNVIVLLPAIEVLSVLLQLPPYAMVPASVELKV